MASAIIAEPVEGTESSPTSFVARSSSFHSPLVTSFMDDCHRKFLSLVRLLDGRLHSPLLLLTLQMSFGMGYTASSTMTAEPRRLFPALFQRPSNPIDEAMLQANLNNLVEYCHSSFSRLASMLALDFPSRRRRGSSDSSATVCSPAILVFDFSIGGSCVTKSTVTITVQNFATEQNEHASSSSDWEISDDDDDDDDAHDGGHGSSGLAVDVQVSAAD